MSETLFVRPTESSPASDEDLMEDNDVWDDSLLIKAYNEAVDMAKQKVAKKLSAENGTDRPKQSSSSTKSSPAKKSEEAPPSLAWEKIPAKAKSGAMHWRGGSYCRATYSEDGQEYEAVIVDMFAWKGTCQVMYIGYQNDEEVNLADLKPSHGDKARKDQEKEAKRVRNQNTTELNGDPVGQMQQQPYEGGDVGVIPPPPPPNVMAHFPKDQSDALSAMLMAWYMSGYHTGYYQGLTRSTCSKCSNGQSTPSSTSRLN